MNSLHFQKSTLAAAAALTILFLASGCVTPLRQSSVGPWNLIALSKTPATDWGQSTGLVQEVWYQGEFFNGKPTRVFAYLGRPSEKSPRRRPAMVLVHGGGGKAFREWAEHWAQRGYVSLAMDLSGNGPTGRLSDGGPDQLDSTKFRNFTQPDIPDMWTYHAVAAIIRGHSLLRSLPDVDPNRIGITGVSWGGYLTCIAAAADSRFKVAVPVYGCGFLGENSVWKDGSLARMTPESRDLWLKHFDPSQYLSLVRLPILFVNGTTDFAYPLDSYQKSYQLVAPRWRHISVAVNRPHGHIWTFPEVDAFVNSVLRKEPPLVRIGPPRLINDRLFAALDRPATSDQITLCYTTNSGPWQKRKWLTLPAEKRGRQISAALPTTRPIVAFLALTDPAGRHLSSEHIEIQDPKTQASSADDAELRR